MRIVVCIKQVPDTADIKIDPITNTLKREGVVSIINPDDKAGLEAALRLKDNYGAHITVLSMGPPQAKKALSEALAMGADEAILLSDRAFAGSDTLATSKILAAALRKMEYDVIIAGRQAIDGDTAQVGPQLAEHLNLPQVTYASEITYNKNENSFVIKRQMEDRYQLLRVSPPFLVTALSTLNKPRYMSVDGITRLKECAVWGFGDISVSEEEIGLKGSPTRVVKSFSKTYNTDKKVLELSAAESAKMIMQKLKELNLTEVECE